MSQKKHNGAAAAWLRSRLVPVYSEKRIGNGRIEAGKRKWGAWFAENLFWACQRLAPGFW